MVGAVDGIAIAFCSGSERGDHVGEYLRGGGAVWVGPAGSDEGRLIKNRQISARWRRAQSVERTTRLRPDLLPQADLTPQERAASALLADEARIDKESM